MQVKKSNGKIFGANLSAAEKKALDMEISRQLAEYSQKYEEEIEAMVLLMLRAEFGFGEERLKRAHKALSEGIDDLVKRYQMEDGDAAWLCTYKLKEQGFDISKWDKN